MRKTKILFGIGNVESGGAEKQLSLIINGLCPSEFDISVVTIRKPPDHFRYSVPVNVKYINRRFRWRLDELVIELYSFMKEYRPDVVHVWLPEVLTIPMAICANLLNQRVISSFRRKTFVGLNRREFPREVLQFIPHFISDLQISNYNLKYENLFFKKIFHIQNILRIPNGVEVLNSSGAKVKRNKEEKLKLLFVGRFVEQKRLVFLIKALSEIPKADWLLSVYGRGTEERERKLKDLANVLGLSKNIEFIGFRPDWRKFSYQYDFLVLPSASEGMPNVLLEAMVDGLPVVGSNIPEIKEFVHDGKNGFLFERDNLTSLKNVLKKLCNLSDVEICSLSNEAVKSSLVFTQEGMVSEYMRIYRKVSIL